MDVDSTRCQDSAARQRGAPICWDDPPNPPLFFTLRAPDRQSTQSKEGAYSSTESAHTTTTLSQAGAAATAAERRLYRTAKRLRAPPGCSGGAPAPPSLRRHRRRRRAGHFPRCRRRWRPPFLGRCGHRRRRPVPPPPSDRRRRGRLEQSGPRLWCADAAGWGAKDRTCLLRPDKLLHRGSPPPPPLGRGSAAQPLGSGAAAPPEEISVASPPRPRSATSSGS